MSPLKTDNTIIVPQLQAGKAEISMAPLIDVVFLLLIFFMVTTVFPENRGLMIERPESRHSEALALDKMTFHITRDNTFFYRDKPIDERDMERLVRQQLRRSADTAVLLHVDRLSSTETLIKAMDACKLGGASQVGIATDAAATR